METNEILIEIGMKLDILITLGYGILGVMILQFVKGAIKGWRI
jgi:hypothetical protein